MPRGVRKVDGSLKSKVVEKSLRESGRSLWTTRRKAGESGIERPSGDIRTSRYRSDKRKISPEKSKALTRKDQ